MFSEIWLLDRWWCSTHSCKLLISIQKDKCLELQIYLRLSFNTFFSHLFTLFHLCIITLLSVCIKRINNWLWRIQVFLNTFFIGCLCFLLFVVVVLMLINYDQYICVWFSFQFDKLSFHLFYYIYPHPHICIQIYHFACLLLCRFTTMLFTSIFHLNCYYL